ncbi:Lysophospholipase, alpha-beta hydrolase superfamily [Marinobacter gudaonensis]|uniref:Lysophospholipase, alpha-beta hydrolase superfamily n=1 Tax=Marinobacter gudaonensis TaxID=375760 RepID=A0A1I6GCM0_9GAMM|nr:alpha/beta hydrolase [Marinobacter gudaonensis]SFR39942.1 Lysophospholipase, alpha-beta hydrolase superfamily [Marinobacter gudaonensis]
MSDTATSVSAVAGEGPPGFAKDELQGCREAQWKLRHITLAGLSWACEPGVHENTPTLLVHGWLDNSLSFARLAPDVARLGPVHAIDLAGHGHSGHRPEGQSYQLMDYVADLAELVERYFQETADGCVNLVGHSLGGIVCALYAATFPERVRQLVMIDSLGAISRPASETVSQLRKAIKKRISGSGMPPVYPDIAAAARAREGGLSPLSREAALILSPRNLTSVEEGYVWRTDPRLRHPSPLMMTEEQVLATLEAIEAPTLFIRADAGLLSYRKDLDARAGAIARLQTVRVPGGHHCHLDGETAPVADAVVQFLEGE